MARFNRVNNYKEVFEKLRFDTEDSYNGLTERASPKSTAAGDQINPSQVKA